MLSIRRCREILGRGDIVLSENELGHLMEILHYFAVRVCEQAEQEILNQKRKGDEKTEAQQGLQQTDTWSA